MHQSWHIEGWWWGVCVRSGGGRESSFYRRSTTSVKNNLVQSEIICLHLNLAAPFLVRGASSIINNPGSHTLVRPLSIWKHPISFPRGRRCPGEEILIPGSLSSLGLCARRVSLWPLAEHPCSKTFRSAGRYELHCVFKGEMSQCLSLNAKFLMILIVQHCGGGGWVDSVTELHASLEVLPGWYEFESAPTPDSSSNPCVV